MSNSFIMKRIYRTEFLCTNCWHREEENSIVAVTKECPHCTLQNYEKRKKIEPTTKGTSCSE